MTFIPRYLETEADHSEQYGDPQAALLRQLSSESLSRVLTKIALSAPETTYWSRLETELQILETQGYCGYYLIVADYVNWAKGNGIAVGPGRGSGPCSLVGFALGITNIDPIRHDLPFERFVNPERNMVPDFDLDFCARRYGEVTNYIQRKYGADRVARISSDDGTPLASRLVIGDRPIAEIAPLSSHSDSGFLTTKLTLAEIADEGLVQFNAINQKALTVIQKTVQNLARSNIEIDINKIPLDDEGAYRLLCAGEKSTIVELGVETYPAALKVVKPVRFNDLCAVIALCYPKLNGSLSLYAERKQKTELIHYIHPDLEDITKDTYGLVLYQEQLMHITHKIAGFSMAQGDLFRRALNKPNADSFSRLRKKFIGGAQDFGLSQDKATGLFEQLALTGRNSFNKSHAVAFAFMEYQTAWLKANYPTYVTDYRIITDTV